MKRVIVLSVLAMLLLAIPALLWGKGHVPNHKSQLCHSGEVIEVGSPAAAAHSGHGDMELPACDFANVFHKGESCGGPLAPRDDAGGVTPGCPEGRF